MENSTPCNPENFILKFGTRDDVEEITYYTIFLMQIAWVGASPQIGEI